MASTLVLCCPCSCSVRTRTRAAISVPRLPQRIMTSKPRNLTKEFTLMGSEGITKSIPLVETRPDNNGDGGKPGRASDSVQRSRLYAVLEEVIDRIEMHRNIGEQRNNWNSLMLGSINTITLTGALMAGMASGGGGDSVMAMKMASTVLLASATSMVAMMNKIQPSQLVEEQRNATRLFTQLRFRIESVLMREETEVGEDEVKEAMERVLCIDRAYPLPLLGAMLEKFPKEFKPSIWWPQNNRKKAQTRSVNRSKIENGWSKELEMEMEEVMEVVKRRDSEEYKNLGDKALRLNRVLAMSGPVLTGVSAIASAFIGHGSCWAGVAATTLAALGSAVNALEHGGQVGMVFEMYRNSAGFFSELEDSIRSTIGESETGKRENGEVFETKIALKLGRSLSELRDLARKSGSSRVEGSAIDEFASKLF
ncbi:PREDICTED: probable F-box protein At4g22030 [Tarenaya hassleriana]|uniref:probable F-box protein At4g22030 n=1 Tax=Tarenaya hassleriana TaxID=28532 RepID=UPI00053C5F9F|nr:PREDICTED: probable F-box protein At4g22030 [Tarenaya hassleriana]